MQAIEAEGPDVTLPVERSNVRYKVNQRFKHFFGIVHCTAETDADTQEYEIHTEPLRSGDIQIPDDAQDVGFAETDTGTTVVLWLTEVDE